MMKAGRKIFLVFIISVLLFAYNNCIKIDGAEPFGYLASIKGGNGTGYDGKPDPGTYYRQVYGAACNVDDIIAELNISEEKVELLKRSIFNCYESTTTLLFNELVHYRNFSEVIGYNGGIYLNSESYEKGFVPELWCRSEDTSYPTHYLLLYNPKSGELKTKWVRGETEYKAPNTNRTVVGQSATYDNSAFSLSVDLSTEVIKGDKNYAGKVFEKDNNMTRHVSCVSGSNTLPENTVYDLTNEIHGFNTGIKFNYFSKNQKYGLIIEHDGGKDLRDGRISVFDFEIARKIYEYKDNTGNGYSFIKTLISDDEKYLYVFLRAVDPALHDIVETINLGDQTKKVIDLGENKLPIAPYKSFFIYDFYFENNTYFSIVLDSKAFPDDLLLALVNKKTGEIAAVDTFREIDSYIGNYSESNWFKTAGNYIFYSKPILKQNYAELPWNEQILNYSVVAYNVETKNKTTLSFDGSVRISLDLLPDSSTLVLGVYNNEVQSKIIIFDEVSQSFINLKINPETPIIGGIKHIAKEPESRNYYFLSASSKSSTGIYILSLDLQSVHMLHDTPMVSPSLTSLDFRNNSLLIYDSSAVSNNIVLVDVISGKKLNSWESLQFSQINETVNRDQFLKNANGRHVLNHFKRVPNPYLSNFTTTRYFLDSVEKIAGQWVKKTVLDDSVLRPIVSDNCENAIYVQSDLLTNEYVVMFNKISSNNFVELFRVNALDYEFNSLGLAPNEKYIYVNLQPNTEYGGLRLRKTYLIRMPSY